MLGTNQEVLQNFIGRVKEPTFLRNEQGKVISLTEEQAKSVELLKLPQGF